MEATAIEVFTAAIGVLTAGGCCSWPTTCGKLNRKFDRLEGRVNKLSVSHNADVNAPGLHAGR